MAGVGARLRFPCCDSAWRSFSFAISYPAHLIENAPRKRAHPVIITEIKQRRLAVRTLSNNCASFADEAARPQSAPGFAAHHAHRSLPPPLQVLHVPPAHSSAPRRCEPRHLGPHWWFFTHVWSPSCMLPRQFVGYLRRWGPSSLDFHFERNASTFSPMPGTRGSTASKTAR